MAHRRSRESARGPRARPCLVVLVGGAALVWLLLVDTFKLDELIVGALAAAIAGHRRRRRSCGAGYIRFSPRAAWLLRDPVLSSGRVRRLLCCWPVRCGAERCAAQRVRGVTVRVPFHHGDDSGRDGARRALVNFAVSLTPNSYVVDIDPEGDSLLVHRLVPVPLDRVLRPRNRRAAELATRRSETQETSHERMVDRRDGACCSASCPVRCRDPARIGRRGPRRPADGGRAEDRHAAPARRGFHRPPFFDLALVLALLTLAGGLVFARMLERWV